MCGDRPWFNLPHQVHDADSPLLRGIARAHHLAPVRAVRVAEARLQPPISSSRRTMIGVMKLLPTGSSLPLQSAVRVMMMPKRKAVNSL